MYKMAVKKTKTTKEYSHLTAILKGLVVSYIITIPVFFIFALVLSKIDSCANLVSPVVLITTILGVMAAGMVSARCIKSRGWLNGGITGVLYMLVLFILGSIIYMDFSINRNVLFMFLIGILAGIVGGILGVNTKIAYKKR